MSASDDVTALIDKANVFALNESVAASHSHLFEGDRTNHVLSDADASLLIFVPFRDPVRLSAVVIDAPPALFPTSVKLFVNAKAMGFDDAESAEPSALLLLGEGDLGAPIKLRPAKMGGVFSLHVYATREGGEKVALSKLAFFGTPMQVANVANIKAVAHEH
jgi:hypothetical protein